MDLHENNTYYGTNEAEGMNAQQSEQHNAQSAQGVQGIPYTPAGNVQYPYADHQHGYAYYPEFPVNDAGMSKKKGRGKKVLKGIAATAAALVCVAAIGAGSIFGYTLITGDSAFGGNKTQQDSSVSDQKLPIESTDNEQRPVREVPTLAQLASLDNALSVPDIVNKVSPSVVGVSCMLSGGTASGTGFVISEDGYIVTNYHVIDGARAISVTFSLSDDENEYEATLIGGDEQTDIAVLKIDKTGLTPVEFGISSDLIVGELAVTIGNPLGSQLSGTVTAGIISALNRTLTIEEREMTLIQTDASINSGNSGGPLINSYGQVVGITSAKISDVYADGLGFAIPIDEALPIISDLIEYGYVTGRPIVGISGEDISDIYAQYYNIPKGFIVRAVTENGPAARGGVKVGDVVIGIEGTLIESVDEFNDVKENYKAGDTITISVYRDGEIVDLEITLDEDKSALESRNEQDDYNDYGYYGYNYSDPFYGFGY